MTELDGTRYIGITLDWDYRRRQVQLSLPGHINRYLKQFNYTQKNLSYPSATIIYGSKKKYATQPSSAPLLDKKGKKFIQQVCGFFILRESCRQHTALPNQRNCITLRKSKRRNNEANPTTVGLNCNSRGRSHHIHQQRHETSSPHRCKLP